LDYSAVKSIGIIGTIDAATPLDKMDVEEMGCVVKIPKCDKNKNSKLFCALCDEQHRIGLLTRNTVFPALEDNG
jgi:hypothetical protein